MAPCLATPQQGQSPPSKSTTTRDAYVALLTPGCRSFAAPARPTLGHEEGTAGEDDAARIVTVMAASSGDG